MTKTRNSAPALRFKDEHGNDYPDWEQNKLGNIGTTFNGLTGKNSTHFGKGKPYIQYLQVFENSRIDIDEFGFVEIGENESQNKVCSGDVFFTTSSETPNEVGTASVLIDEVKNTYLNSFCFGYRVNKEYLLPEYARFAFRASSFRKKLVPLAQGSTRYNLSKTSLMQIITKLPSIKEQQIIASFLSSVDTKIEQLGKKKALLEQYKKGITQKLFNQEIRFKDEQGNDYLDWEGNTLGMLFEISAGGDIENSHSRKNKDGIFRYPIYANSEKEKGLHGYSDRYSVKQNCITVSGRGTLGVAHARFEKFFPIVRLLVLIPRKESNLIFFKHAINLLQIFKESTGVPQLTAPQLKKYHLNYPSIKEQQKIANFLSAIDKKIELVAEQLEQARTYKKGLLQQMFI